MLEKAAIPIFGSKKALRKLGELQTFERAQDKPSFGTCEFSPT